MVLVDDLGATVADRVTESIELQRRLLEPEHLDAIVHAASAIIECFRSGGKLIVFGNGGSAADAQHIAAEFLGRYLRERAPMPALALADNAAAVTAIGNDYAFRDIFSRQLQGLCEPCDVALGISTSGTSQNVVDGIVAARRIGATTIGLTGAGGGELAPACDICVRFPSSATPRIQEGHTLVSHILCEIVEDAYAAGS